MKKKHPIKIVISSILLALLLGFFYLRFDRLKLINCLKNVEKERQTAISNQELTSDKIISIEQTMDNKRDECYTLYKH